MKHHEEMDAQAKKMGAKTGDTAAARRQELQATKASPLSFLHESNQSEILWLFTNQHIKNTGKLRSIQIWVT